MALLAELTPEDLSVKMLRICTAGSVDDGKSTLIGRLLYDCRAIPEDQYEAIKRATGPLEEATNLALLTDGLRAEREQQITIDVAYRFFSTSHRRFILADTPGHAQYTRNMVTGASTADLAIILVDARKGLLSQSRRHAIISSMLRVPKVLVAVNKMDLVDFSEIAYTQIEESFTQFATGYSTQDIAVIPISALKGDNIVEHSRAMPWYRGPSLLEFLEELEVENVSSRAFRFPVQCVIRPNQDFRGYAGQVASGSMRIGDEVTVLPTGIQTRVKDIVTRDGSIASAIAGDSIVLVLEEELDISRGDLICGVQDLPNPSDRFEVELCWMGNQPHRPGKSYVAMHGTRQIGCVLEDEIWIKDVETLEETQAITLKRNDLARAVISTLKPLYLDAYSLNRSMGALLLVDPDTNVPAAAAMVTRFTPADQTAGFDI